MRKKWAVIGLCAVLAGCSEQQNTGICLTPTSKDVLELETADAKTDGDDVKWYHRQLIAEHCIHREAYKLARGRDAVETVGAAALYACAGPISQVHITRLIYRQQMNDADADANLDAEFQAMARFRVVQQRAGHCDMPPFESLLPASSAVPTT